MSPHLAPIGAAISVKPIGNDALPAVPVVLRPVREAILKEEPGTLIWRDALADGTNVAVKLYRRGFPVWLRSRLTRFRANHEFACLGHLVALGIPCSQPLFWSQGRFGAHGWGDLLVTKWVDDSRPLADILASGAPGAAALDLTPIFACVARLHAAGIRHGTLLARNILVQSAAWRPAFVFIDMPRFHRFPHSIRSTRMALYDLLYLCDSLARHCLSSAVPAWLTAYEMPAEEQPAFLAALRRFRNTSRLRRLIGAEFNLRHILARACSFG